MAKCKCGSKSRIISNVVQSIDNNECKCQDVCAHPICKEPHILSLFAPLIYDEIGINLCTTFGLDVDIATTYPTVTNASVKVLNATYTYGAGNVSIEAINGRPNCYVVTLSNLTFRFAVNLYDASCHLVATLYPTAVYLPSDTTAPTYDEDTNPSSVELGIFAPYGLSYDTTAATPTPTINYVGFSNTNNAVRQGINLYSMAKLLDFSTDDSTVTVGLTLVLQSLYFSGYKVHSAGRIDVPKGSIVTPENSDCMRFVNGELLNLAIKPLDLGRPLHEEKYKNDCNESDKCSDCSSCSGGASPGADNLNLDCYENDCSNGAADDTTVIPGIPT